MPTLGVNTTRLGNLVRSVLELAADNGTAGGHVLPDDLFGLLLAADLTRAGIVLPSWPTTGRPGSNANPGTPVIGQVGFNTSTGHLEVYAAANLWTALAFSSEAGGGGTTINPGNQFVIDPTTHILSLAANGASSGQVMTFTSGGVWAPATPGSASSGSTPVVVDGVNILATSGTPYPMGPGDRNIKFKRASPGPSYVVLPQAPIIGAHYSFKDMQGDAGTNNNLVSAPVVGGTQALIDGANSLSLNDNWMGVVLVPYSAIEWGRIGSYNQVIVPADSGGAQDTDRVLTVRGTTNTPLFSTVAQVRGSSGGGSGSAPVNTAVPSISGTAQVGQTLTATQGTWSNSPTSYAYQWLRAGSAISGATSSTYVPVSADIGSALTVTVTATNASGSASATSTATSAVIAAAPPSMTFTGTPAFAAGKYGQALVAASGLTGTMPGLVIPANQYGHNQANLTLDGYISASGTFAGDGAPFLSVTNNGMTFGPAFDSSGKLFMQFGNASSASATVRDNAQHYWVMIVSGGTNPQDQLNCYFFLDGSQVGTTVVFAGLFPAATLTLNYNGNKMKAGDLLDELEVLNDAIATAAVPSAAPTRYGKTAGLLHLDGSGAGS